MDRKQLIKEYIEFFKSKSHKEIPNSSLVPENDPSVLFTTAGMHPLVPFLLGQKHTQGNRLVNVQRCIRTQDIESIGDEYHHTFFEMLGNWSIGNYFKKEAIEYSFEFLTRILQIPINRIAITCFAGDKNAPKDNESFKTWRKLGIPESRIAFLNKEDNWWGPAGITGPCGPDTEIFYWKPNNKQAPDLFEPKDKNWVEIWNNVFMEYVKDKKGNYSLAKQKNVDTGMGVERTTAILNKLEDNYLGDSFKLIIEKIEKLSNKKYPENEFQKPMRIIADHIKASVFIIADGVLPSNTEQGYVLRRLIRRAVRYGKKLNLKNFISKIAEPIFEIYSDYKHLLKNKSFILKELEKEEGNFNKTLEKGITLFERIAKEKKLISRKDAFLLYQSFGFPIEMTIELANEKKIQVDVEGFYEEEEMHQKLSRTATKGKFKSGLADESIETTKLHTTAHLLLSAIRQILKREDIIQKGSNITPERLRLDFNFSRKLTEKELKEIEDLVNAQIQKAHEIKKQELTLEQANKKGFTGIFKDKYGEKVSVYEIGNFSKEICAGPHVSNLKELGHFKIIKEESSSSGVRRIKAVLEK